MIFTQKLNIIKDLFNFMEIKPADIRLLQYVYSHAREPVVKIARAVKLTRDQVSYKLKKFEEHGLIRKYITIFNYQKLGYSYYLFIFAKFRKNEYRNTFENKLEKNQNCISHGRVLGKYDLFANMIFKNEKDSHEKILELSCK